MAEKSVEQIVQELMGDPVKLAEFLKGVVSGKVPEKYRTAVENSDAFNQYMTEAMKTPSGQAAIKDMLREKQTDRFVKQNKPFFDAILSGVDLATSLTQIKNSNKAIRELQRPSMPNPNVLDPALNNAISKAQQGSLDALRALEPAKQEIAQQRLMDMQTAKSVSGGQAGAYGAQATAAGLRANRAAAGLAPLGDNIRARQQQRADNLIGVRQGVRQQEFQNRFGIAQENMQQYQQDAAAAGALGQAGRQNLRMTLGQLPEMITRTAGNMMPVQDVWDQYGSQVEQNLAQRMTQSSNAFRTANPVQAPQFTAQGFNRLPQQGGIAAAQQMRNARLQPLRDYTANRYTRPDLNYPQRLPGY